MHKAARLATRAMRAAACLGRTDLVSQVLTRLESCNSTNLDVKVWASLCAVMLGNRTTAIESLKLSADSSGTLSEHCFKLAILAMPIELTYSWLREWASLAQRDPIARRSLIRGCGLSGDVRYVPWLIEQMNDAIVARIAGEAFTFITGANLALLDLERKPPENIPGSPNDDPDDDNVALDEDENLPWPDVARVHTWWSSHAARFPAGHRYLLGAPVSNEQCLKVLNIGGQRQRAVAAVTRCLLKPGTPLFQVAAPAWRQKRWLAELGVTTNA
jgi:uncharacterized protein (TIGR02270 family)